MTGPIVIDTAEWAEILHALFWIAFVGGIAGSVFMSLCSEVYRWIERRIERRQREREFLEDMGRIVDELPGVRHG